jgi:A/G-specific adenine glycosylase
VWLSEIILQQTQVKQGWAYWERFMQRWPTVDELAAATEDEVLREWQGLGYYSRARNLYAAARQVVGQGGFPATIEGLRALKGVGDYTAAAIGSIAFDLPTAVVDGNVYRVLARHFGISTPINTTEGRKEFAALAQENLLPALNREGQGAGLYNQAIMDFGAIQCTPASPHCHECPLQETCVALREGRVADLPVKLRTLKVKERHLTYIYIRYEGQTAIHRRPAGDIWQGLYEPWLVEEVLQPEDRNVTRIPADAILLRQNVRHILTHRVLYADFWLWEPQECPQLPDGYFWIKEKDIDDYGVPRLIEIMLNELNKRI